MTAVAIAALALCATAMGLVVWLVPKVVKKTEGGADVAIALGATEAELERVKGELDTMTEREGESRRMAEHLAEELADEIKNRPGVGAGAADDDVATRLRAFRRYQAARVGTDPGPVRRPDEVLPEGGEAVADRGPSA